MCVCVLWALEETDMDTTAQHDRGGREEVACFNIIVR